MADVRYQVRGTLGEGGFATVYRAWDSRLNREVALKALLPHLAADPEVRARFLAEARAIASLKHPNVITIYDVDDSGDRPFFTMELIDGASLDLVLGEGRLPLEQVAEIVRGVGGALDALHRAGLIHRDIKPGNVMIGADGVLGLRPLDRRRHAGAAARHAVSARA